MNREERLKNLTLTPQDFSLLTSMTLVDYEALPEDKAEEVVSYLEELNNEISEIRNREVDMLAQSHPLSSWLYLRIPGTRGIQYRDLLAKGADPKALMVEPFKYIDDPNA